MRPSPLNLNLSLPASMDAFQERIQLAFGAALALLAGLMFFTVALGHGREPASPPAVSAPLSAAAQTDAP